MIWKNAVPSGDLLAQSAAAPFIVNFTQVDKDGGSGKISKSEFEDACAKGLVRVFKRQRHWWCRLAGLGFFNFVDRHE